MIDHEDKAAYVKYGESKEFEFIANIAPMCGLHAIIHPEKNTDPYHADLIVNGNTADLKYQETPFFSAKKKFNIDPQYAVTLNKKDVDRYTKLYPDIHIYFWVERRWEIKNGVEIKEMSGVWGGSLTKIKILASRAPVYTYFNRKDDTKGNAKESYILDLADLKLIRRWL